MDAKIDQLNSELRLIRSEICTINDDIRQKQKESQATSTIARKNMESSSIDEKIQCMFGCIALVINDTDAMKKAFVSTAIELDSKIKQMEHKEKSMEETMSAVLHALDPSNCSTQPRYTKDNISDENEYDTLANAVECIQHQVNKLNLMVMQDDEKFKKIDRQLHVLSAKFVHFSTQINHLILDFNREKNTKIEPGKYIDADAKNFIEHESPTCENDGPSNRTETPRQARTHSDGAQRSTLAEKNISTGGVCSAGRAHTIRNIYAFTKHTKIRIRDVNIVDIETFANEVKKEIGNTIGENVIDKVHINKCVMRNGAACEVTVIVAFRVPVSYQYLIEFAFLSNWQFFACCSSRRNYNRNGAYQRKHKHSTAQNQNKSNNNSNMHDQHHLSHQSTTARTATAAAIETSTAIATTTANKSRQSTATEIATATAIETATTTAANKTGNSTKTNYVQKVL